MAGLRLDNRADALKGGDSGTVIRPGNSAESKLIHLVSGLRKNLVMPLASERLTAEQVGVLRAWIDQGAAWPVTPMRPANRPKCQNQEHRLDLRSSTTTARSQGSYRTRSGIAIDAIVSPDGAQEEWLCGKKRKISDY